MPYRFSFASTFVNRSIIGSVYLAVLLIFFAAQMHPNRTASRGPVFCVKITLYCRIYWCIDFEKSNYKYKSLNCSTVCQVAYTCILNNSCPLRNGP